MQMVTDEKLKVINVFIDENVTKISFLTEQEPLSLFYEWK